MLQISGRVLVRPGDMIVADGDGVIVVPRDKAVAGAKYAKKILDGDKNGPRELYRKMNIPADKNVE